MNQSPKVVGVQDMLKIEVECMEDILMAGIRDHCAEKLAGLKCPDHNGEVTLILTNGAAEISVSNVETCCDRFRDAIIVALRANQAASGKRIKSPLPSIKFPNVISISLLMVLFASCGSGTMMAPTGQPPMSQNPEFAFVANFNSGSVSVFEIDSSGMMFSAGTFATGAAPEFMAADAAGKFLFVANTTSNNVSAFQIDSTTGKLTPVVGSPFAAGAQPEGVAIVSAANLLFVADNLGNSISAFHVDPTSGALSPVQGSPFNGVTAPFGTATDITGKFLFVTNLNANTVSVFSIDSGTGMLTQVAGSPFPTGSTPIGLAADPMGSFVYVGDHMSNAVSPFSVDPVRGSLSPVTPLPTLNQNCSSTCHTNPLRVVIHPTARLAFTADVGANSISSFTISDGVLTQAAGPIPTGQHPFGVAADPSGKFVYVVNKLDDNIAAFSVDTMTGALTPLANSPFPAGGSEPVGIVIVRPQ